MSFGSGMFDGQNPPSTTFIFDGNIFDDEIALPMAANQIVVLVHDNSEKQALTHGNQEIAILI